MVGRELQKIRPHGEDHQGRVRARRLGVRESMLIGKMIDGLRK